MNVLTKAEREKERAENSAQRLEFVRQYAAWVKRTPNKIWSKQQKELID